MNIGEKIKDFRKNCGLTQEKLADFLNVSCQAVSKWECGIACPDLSLIGPMARLFSCSADELLGLNRDADEALRAEFDTACLAYTVERAKGPEEHKKAYHLASEAVREYPGDFRYLLWLADAEYDLAMEPDDSEEYFTEMIDNAMRHYNLVIENCDDPKIQNRAIWGMIRALNDFGRTEEALWYAECAYPEKQEKTRDDAIDLCLAGEERLRHRQKMVDDAVTRLLQEITRLQEAQEESGLSVSDERIEKLAAIKKTAEEYRNND